MPTPPVVFMVDDDPHILKPFSRLLANVGIRVLTHDAPDLVLIRLDAGETPGLIITDHDMPGMTGIDLAKAARAKGYAGPIALFTANPRIEKPDFIDRVIPKPIDIAAFRAAVAEMLG